MSLGRADLPYTFASWFSRFDALTEVQRRAIPEVLTGADVLISSATASGKTEAFAAPAAELVRATRAERTTALFIAPTRALTNDLFRRLEGPMQRVEVSLGRYTGEHKERVDGRLPDVVIATPEALDSLLARRAALLAGLRMVVLDEVHVLDGTARGDQLRILLARLEAACEARPQRIAVSATVDDPQALAGRYLREARTVVVDASREILGSCLEGRGLDDMARHLDALAGYGFKKVLVFCRARNSVERFAAKLRGRTRFGDAVHAHHGSLARNERERTERLFLGATAAVCFATLTLEMGIDIGSVDYVVLADLPSDVASLLQRIGRGGRRSGATRCGYVADSPAERHVFRTQFRAGKEGRLCGAEYAFRPSVLVQQAAVLAASAGYVTARELEPFLVADARSALGAGGVAELLSAAAEAGVLEAAGGGRFVASEDTEARYVRGQLHANLDEVRDLAVVDRMTGDVVGRVHAADARRIELGGRDRRIAKAGGERILTDAGRGASAARFRPSAAPGVSVALAREVVRSLGVDEGALAVAELGGAHLLVHGLGSRGGDFLAELCSRQGTPVVESGPYVLTLARRLEELPGVREGDVERFLSARGAALARSLALGPWERAVPREVHRRTIRALSEVDTVARALDRARLQVLDGPALEAVAEVILSL